MTSRGFDSISKVFGNPSCHSQRHDVRPLCHGYTLRVKDNLTFTLGLRYEYWGTWRTVCSFRRSSTRLGFGVPGAVFPNMYAFQQQPDRNNFAPRLGIAYTPRWGKFLFGDQKTVFAPAMACSMTDCLPTSWTTLRRPLRMPPEARLSAAPAADSRMLWSSLVTLHLFSVRSTSRTRLPTRLRNPVTQQWNLDVQRELPGKLVLTTSYVATTGREAFCESGLQWRSGRELRRNFVRLNPNFSEIVVRIQRRELPGTTRRRSNLSAL